jgi:hypothetical protein
MDKIFTQEDILLFIYGEMPSKLQREFVRAMSSNPSLKEQYLQVHSTVDLLDGELLSPSSTSVSIIMEQSHDSPTLEMQ